VFIIPDISGIAMRTLLALLIGLWAATANAQTPPSAAEIERYTGLHQAAATGNIAEISRLVSAGRDINAHDGNLRTPLQVAVYTTDTMPPAL
jgi:ankyrin repeat protein